MKQKRFANVVGDSGVSDNLIDIKAYSYCAAEGEKEPCLVLWPKETEEVARILRETNQIRDQVIIRGAGTNQSSSTIGERAIIVSSERMNKIIRIDQGNRLCEVQAGVRLCDLNRRLAQINMTFPMTTMNRSMTVGGLLALDSIGRESHRVGSMAHLCEEVEFVDGTGKVYYTHKTDLVAGKHGLNGMITRIKLNIMEQPTVSIDIVPCTETTDALSKVRLLSKDKETIIVELIDKKCSEELGLQQSLHLVIGYNSLKGRYKSFVDVKKHMELLDSLPSIKRKNGFLYWLDVSCDIEKTYDLIQWCEKMQLPLHGHAAAGLFFVYFRHGESALEADLRAFVKGLGGSVGRQTGVSTAEFMSADQKKAFMRLKDEYDYNNTLSPGKIITYR